jgi:hypothetical protein
VYSSPCHASWEERRARTGEEPRSREPCGYAGGPAHTARDEPSDANVNCSDGWSTAQPLRAAHNCCDPTRATLLEEVETSCVTGLRHHQPTRRWGGRGADGQRAALRWTVLLHSQPSQRCNVNEARYIRRCVPQCRGANARYEAGTLGGIGCLRACGAEGALPAWG